MNLFESHTSSKKLFVPETPLTWDQKTSSFHAREKSMIVTEYVIKSRGSIFFYRPLRAPRIFWYLLLAVTKIFTLYLTFEKRSIARIFASN